MIGLASAFVRRDLRIQMSYRSDMVLQLLTVLFSLILFFYIGKLVSADRVGGISGGDYFSFVVVGLVALRLAQSGMGAFSTSLRAAQILGTFEVLVATPTRPHRVVLLGGTFEMLRGIALAIVTLAVAIGLFGTSFESSPSILAYSVAVIGGLIAVLAAVGLAIAAATLVAKETATLAALVATGLGLFGGVFFPLDVLPAPLQAIGEALPFPWGVEALRAALIDGDLSVARALGVYGAALVLLPLAAWLLDRSLRRAKREGSLSQH